MGEVRGVQTRAQKEQSNEEEVRREKEEKIEEWRREQSKDEWVKKTREGLSEAEGGKRKWSELVELPNSTMRLTWADLTMESGLLFIRSRDHRNLLYVPEWMRGKIVQDMHESVLLGHAGTKKLCQLLKREFVWGGMDKDVAEVIKKCTRCRLSNAGKKFVSELVPRIVKEPMEVVAVDLLDLGKGLRGSRYALVIIDMYSRYAGAYPIKDKRAETVARTFMDRWVLENGRVPKALLSDNGGEFVNGIMDEIIRLWKIESKTTLPYHSRANGGVERLNRTLTDILRRMEGSPEEWESALPYALYVYNNTPHSTTGETPAFLLYGRDERLPGGEPTKMDERYVVDRGDYLTRMQILMKKTHNEVNERLEVEREKMKKAYDNRNRYRKSNEPQMGDRVYVKKELNGEKNAKLMIEWEGPYRVIGRSTTTAELRRMEDGKEKTVQLDRIRKVEEEVTERGMRVRVVQEGDKKKLSRYEVTRGDRLDWNTPCRECGPRTLGEVWNSLPTAWHHLHIARARDLVVVAALRRIEGEGLGALYVKKSIERSDLAKVEKEDVEEGMHRSLCQHATPLLDMAATTAFDIEKGLVPTRLEQAYREALGEIPRTRKIRALVLAHTDYERIREREESKGDWIWKCTSHSQMEESAREFAENGGKVVVVWPSQWATLEKVHTTLTGVARAMRGRGQAITMIPPLSRDDGPVEARWREGWMRLCEEKGENMRLVPDTGRYTMEGVGIDNLGLWISKPAREDYERILAGVVEGKKVRVWEREKEKERDQEENKSKEIICHGCGQAGHFRRKCPLLRRKGDVSGADEKKDEKGDERKERVKRTDEGGVRNRGEDKSDRRRDYQHEDRYRRGNDKGGLKRYASGGRRYEGGGDAKKSKGVNRHN